MKHLIRMLVPLVLITACSPAEKAPEPPPAAAAAAPMPNAMFMAPMNGDTSGVDVKVSLMAEGVKIDSAAKGVIPGTGHYHLFLDVDPTPATVVIPPNSAQIMHLGTGAAEYTFMGVKPGPHRLIVVVADGAHMPMATVMPDTVNFIVK